MADKNEERLFSEGLLQEMTPEELRLALENPVIHIDYSPEWYEEMRKAAEEMNLPSDFWQPFAKRNEPTE